jgi:hypothetical protein
LSALLPLVSLCESVKLDTSSLTSGFASIGEVEAGDWLNPPIDVVTLIGGATMVVGAILGMI